MVFSIIFALPLVAHVTFAATSSYPTKPPFSTIQPALTDIRAAQATVMPASPTSNVQGKAFNRIIQIWLENTDYDKAAADPNMQWLQSQGILLTNYWAVTHPSEPNYIAVVGGDDFGMENDDFNRVAKNVSTVVDLLDTKGISWGEYQEDMPYPGFLGFNFTNQQNTSRNDYVRKHNPLIIFDSVTSNATRLPLIKNFTSFDSDLKAQTLPQWSFMTPNMTNDGHDTTITFASIWARTFLEPLLKNPYFMNNTLVVLTFDEDDTYPESNKVFTVLLGGAIAGHENTTDDTFYNHYSMLSTVELNWGLPSLGRWDCNANVLALVANKTGYTNQKVDTKDLFFNASYPGPLSDSQWVPVWPVPATNAKCATGSVLASVVSTWGKSDGSFDYTNVYPLANSSVSAGTSPSSTASGTGSSTSSTSSPSSSTKPSAANINIGSSCALLLGLAGIVSAFIM
ncbi:phosphoesterase-domain-containing protein [Hyaloscypha bicolor E]|uniref:Phosphoesterase-domain-containing protein n=1 Tax=Hyaloscypha bicolor E TaxID=1095630 RepID=A0A2J6SUP3_9HELO|nr:phosphoesterase-domain-containing protein [Hyaloscypha bicolor E]PMD54495.1 phosphoesterase-domain-containing protein [Hyaloscypha bicolor E]